MQDCHGHGRKVWRSPGQHLGWQGICKGLSLPRAVLVSLSPQQVDLTFISTTGQSPALPQERGIFPQSPHPSACSTGTADFPLPTGFDLSSREIK